MTVRSIFVFIIVIIGLFVLNGSLFTVNEGERAIMLRLGDLVRDGSTNKPKIYQPGLHFKVPFITSVRYLDVKLQTVDVDTSRILTAEQKYVIVDYYAKWRIEDVPLYYTRTGGYAIRARMLLKQKINDALRAAFGKRTIREVVSGERSDIMRLLQARAKASAKALGIDVIDVRIKGIDLPTEVREAVFQRMSTEREQVATQLRSQGLAAAEKLRAEADREVAVDIAKAKTEAAKQRASGDLLAAQIYNAAYGRDPKFYALYRSLVAYQQVFKDKNTIMVLKPDGEFFKYFNNANVGHTQ